LFTFIVFVTSLYWLRMHYLVALVVASGCGFVLTYVLNHVWVFKPEDRVRFRGRFAKYVASNAATLALNLVLLYAVVNGTGMGPFYGQLVVMGLIVAINFSAAKWWSLAPSRG
jgi:putative flippase GtrA